MADRLSTFPLLSNPLLKQAGFLGENYSFYYTRHSKELPLKCTPITGDESVHALESNSTADSSWNKESDNWAIRRRFSLSNPGCLFGPQGVACTNAELGLAILWSSQDSRQRGAIEVCNFKHDQGPIQKTIDYQFAQAQLRGQIRFSTVLYLRAKATPQKGEEYLANDNGDILGALDSPFEICLDGSGSIFPIFEFEDKSLPLWTLSCDWIDPAIDHFSDCVSININKSHRSYPDWQNSIQIKAEVLSSALSLIILKATANSSRNTDLGNSEKGSVYEAIDYFINVLGWDNSTPENLSQSIRSFLEKELTEP